ncbi:MAG: acetate/propionate family kinase [Betaproteobacteria bacterium]|nr:acetate/propionate family kinase [Betaproteobacteria bacterium]
MSETLLVLNAGSSSVKFSLFRGEDPEPAMLAHGQIESIGTAPRFSARDAAGREIALRDWSESERLDHEAAIEFLIGWLQSQFPGQRPVAVGHRVVHGGDAFDRPILADRETLAVLERFIPLAPLHQPHNVSAIRIFLDKAPSLAQVACFDTSFHSTQPDVARAFALPREITRLGVRRYGFHGLSYEYVARTLPALDPGAAEGRTVVAHLGSGASLCALRAGKSVASTMGFTALDGLPMGTRCGALDPGAVLYLIDQLGMSVRAVERLLYERSGLLGVSGVSGDMRALLASREPRAAQAIELFVYRINRELGSLAAALGGIDALVFTGGVGENAPLIRRLVCEGAAWLGVTIDAEANERGGPRISAEASRARVWVVPADEEKMIAIHAARLARHRRDEIQRPRDG